jgi:hypothetical protein
MNPAGKDDLIEILKYHAYSSSLHFRKLNNGDKLTTAQGGIIAIRVLNGRGEQRQRGLC